MVLSITDWFTSLKIFLRRKYGAPVAPWDIGRLGVIAASSWSSIMVNILMQEIEPGPQGNDRSNPRKQDEGVIK